ncbi:anti-sigma factor [Actinokineospora enzanensis]|uniref:anti-sigma factor n=1 Tax=Actinokineospora enzanensis TaxID=155975 RepID=UPI00036A7C48|nr:anti-sigma factor [Actinokineospora enzanensis]
MTADIHALTGAYALDAIPDVERAAFERHLAECDSCAQEVRELQATAARLGSAAAVPPPPELKARVLARVSQVRQLPPVVLPRQGSRSWPLRATGFAAAVLLVVSVSLGVLLVRSNSDLDSERTQNSALTGLLSASDARIGSGTAAGGTNATIVVSRSRGQVMVMADHVPPAPAGKVYQGWLMGEGEPRSLGLLNPDAAGRMSMLDSRDLSGARQFGISVEAAGGSTTPSSDIMMSMALPG